MRPWLRSQGWNQATENNLLPQNCLGATQSITGRQMTCLHTLGTHAYISGIHTRTYHTPQSITGRQMIRRLHRKDREQARDYGESVAKLVVAHADFPQVWHQVLLSLSLSLSLSLGLRACPCVCACIYECILNVCICMPRFPTAWTCQILLEMLSPCLSHLKARRERRQQRVALRALETWLRLECLPSVHFGVCRCAAKH